MSTAQPSRDDTREVSGFQEISRRAYEIWEQGGRKEGNDLADWLQAEEEFRREPDNVAIPTEPGLIAREKIAGDNASGDRHLEKQAPVRGGRQRRGI
ncbi:MAG TPA: DUF2934 domain-containing protein [Opitutaceae bacterium]|nr:DUF2934 domain-containing protein [Opitutaceae bacterium]